MEHRLPVGDRGAGYESEAKREAVLGSGHPKTAHSRSTCGFCLLTLLLHGGEVALDHLHGLLELVLRTELHQLRARLHERSMARCYVVRIARVDDLLVIGVPDLHPALQHVPVVRTLAPIVGQTLKQWCDVEDLTVGLEAKMYVAPLGLLDDGLIRLERCRQIFSGAPHLFASSYSAVGLLVPSLNTHLTGDLAVSHLERRRTQDAGPVRILARLVERYALFSYNLVLQAGLDVSPADIFQVLDDLPPASQRVRRAGRGLAVDNKYLGVLGVETCECLGVVLLGSAAQGLEIE